MKKQNYELKEKLFKLFLLANTIIIAIIFGLILNSLIGESSISTKKFGLNFITNEIWQPFISSDEQVEDSLITIKSVVDKGDHNSFNLGVLINSTKDQPISNMVIKLFANYPLEKFSSANLSRIGDLSLNSILLKDSTGNIVDISDNFDFSWDYYAKHKNNFFNIKIVKNDTLDILPPKSSILLNFEIDGASINDNYFNKSWCFIAHTKDIDYFNNPPVAKTAQSFDEFSEDNNIFYNKIDSISTINRAIQILSYSVDDDEEEIITGYGETSEKYGALPYIIGTFITSFLALILALPFSLAIALFLGEFYNGTKFANYLKSLIDLISAIPSVIYGFWGLIILVPIVTKIGHMFGIETTGISILTASLVLAFMIIPYMATISAEVIKLVPNDLKEAAYGLGATRFEVIKNVILPYTKSGIISGILLSLGRALGETMAVTMLIGNVTGKIVLNLFSSSNTMASIIASNFAEAGTILMSSLVEIALLLFIITSILSFLGRYYIRRSTIRE